jgi:hypothetical protein
MIDQEWWRRKNGQAEDAELIEIGGCGGVVRHLTTPRVDAARSAP